MTSRVVLSSLYSLAVGCGSRLPGAVRRLGIVGALLLAPSVARAEAFPPPKWMGDMQGRGANLQRTMRLLATSTPEHRNTVRVLFYGQSITDQNWTEIVAADLRTRFPHANLITENRALGGFSSQLLVKTAETDLYPFQPDLLIFHVYGSHESYADIIRRVRERTTAEILQQNDHLSADHDVAEETDPAKITQNSAYWHGFMNYKWLPQLAREYQTELADQRSIWRRYLTDHNLVPQDLLRDEVHLNDRGDYLMGEIVKSYLRYDPTLPPSPAESWVRTHVVGRDVSWQGSTLRLKFRGTRVDAIVPKHSQASRAARIRIDGKSPAQFPELYAFTRALATPGSKWPVIAPIHSNKLLQQEDWTMQVKTIRGEGKKNTYTFEVTGSRTGPDGSGRSDTQFVSNSGRIVIDPQSWNVEYALILPKIDPVPDTFTVKWTVVPQFVERYAPPAVTDESVETAVTLFQGLGPGEHTLEIEGDSTLPLSALRVYTPPLHEQSAGGAK